MLSHVRSLSLRRIIEHALSSSLKELSLLAAGKEITMGLLAL